MNNDLAKALDSFNKFIKIYRITESTSDKISVDIGDAETIVKELNALMVKNASLTTEKNFLARKLDHDLAVNTKALTVIPASECVTFPIENYGDGFKFSIKLGNFTTNLKDSLIEFLERTLRNSMFGDNNSVWGGYHEMTKGNVINYEIVENEDDLEVYLLIQLTTRLAPESNESFSVKLIGTTVTEIHTGEVAEVNFKTIELVRHIEKENE